MHLDFILSPQGVLKTNGLITFIFRQFGRCFSQRLTICTLGDSNISLWYIKDNNSRFKAFIIAPVNRMSNRDDAVTI